MLSIADKSADKTSYGTSSATYPLLLLAIYAAAWLGLAIAPLDRSDWLLENALPVLAMPLLAYAYRRRLLSNFSYTLVWVFLLLHAVGAHYTYAKVPYEHWTRALGGFSIDGLLGLQRNSFDRLVHFLYGLLLFPIFWELFAARISGSSSQSSSHNNSSPNNSASNDSSQSNTLRYLLVGSFLMAHAGIYEVIEWLAAASFGGDLGAAYLGTQGDQWDAQKDMALAQAGTLLAMILSAICRRSRRRRPAA